MDDAWKVGLIGDARYSAEVSTRGICSRTVVPLRCVGQVEKVGAEAEGNTFADESFFHQTRVEIADRWITYVAEVSAPGLKRVR